MRLASDRVDLSRSPAGGGNPILEAPKASRGRGRKRKASVMEKSMDVVNLTGDDDETELGGMEQPLRGKKSKTSMRLTQQTQGSMTKDKGTAAPSQEKRLRRFRTHPPLSYLEIKDRATSQRLFVIDRVRSGTDEHPNETLTIAGTTGNLYTVKIDQVPSCTCPHALKGNQCKHIVYIMVVVLRAPTDLQYQLALLKSELQLIFSNAPPIPSADAGTGNVDKNRKSVEGDCPICFMPMEEDGERLVYCKAACGNNFHGDCFNHWAASKRAASTHVTCPLCRTNWQSDDGDVSNVRNVAKTGVRNPEGYVNVGSELGLSGQRDYSSYHPFWVRKQARAGVDVGETWYPGRDGWDD